MLSEPVEDKLEVFERVGRLEYSAQHLEHLHDLFASLRIGAHCFDVLGEDNMLADGIELRDIPFELMNEVVLEPEGRKHLVELAKLLELLSILQDREEVDAIDEHTAHDLGLAEQSAALSGLYEQTKDVERAVDDPFRVFGDACLVTVGKVEQHFLRKTLHDRLHILCLHHFSNGVEALNGLCLDPVVGIYIFIVLIRVCHFRLALHAVQRVLLRRAPEGDQLGIAEHGLPEAENEVEQSQFEVDVGHAALGKL